MADLTEALKEMHQEDPAPVSGAPVAPDGRPGWEPFLLPLLLDDFTEAGELSEASLAAAARAAALFPDLPEPRLLVLASRWVRRLPRRSWPGRWI